MNGHFDLWVTVIFWLVIFFLLYPLFLILGLLLSLGLQIGGLLYARFYKYYHKIQTYDNDEEWISCYRFMSRIAHIVGRIWHGYEVIGLENLQEAGKSGILITFYHSAIPMENVYLPFKIFRETGKFPATFAHQSIYNFPGLAKGFAALKMFPGPYEKIVETLKKGNVLIMSPGGAKEMMYSNSSYKLMWAESTKFAKAAKEAKAIIVPAFAQNSREAFRAAHLPKSWCEYIYTKFKVPLAVFYGGIPVKLRIFLGKPIPYDEDISEEDLKQKVKAGIEDLIATHQRIPGNVVLALLDRFRSSKENQNIC